MALDRRISIAVQALGSYDNQGDYQPGLTTTYGAWAEIADKSAFRELETRGTEFDALRRYKVRWTPALEKARPDLMTITDDGDTYVVTNVVRAPTLLRRRQWVYVEAELQEQRP